MLKKRSICVLTIIGGVIFAGGLFFALNTCANISRIQPSHNSGEAVTELNFTFTRMSGFSSNQFAVWIEDSNGQYIKTIYATRFTANGGWRRRETSLPLWVRQSNISEKDQAQIDVLTSATPRTGDLTYTWDGTNKTGETVPDGKYTLILEGTLRSENQVYYRVPIHLGQGASAPQVNIEYTGNAGDDRAMISNVTVRVLR